MLWVFWHLLQGTPKPDFVTFTEKSEYAFRKMGIQHPVHRLGPNSASTIKIGAKFRIQQL